MGLCRNTEKAEIKIFADSLNQGAGNHDMQAVQNMMDEVNHAGCNAPKETFALLDGAAKDAIRLHNSTGKHLPDGKFDRDQLIFGPQS